MCHVVRWQQQAPTPVACPAPRSTRSTEHRIRATVDRRRGVERRARSPSSRPSGRQPGSGAGDRRRDAVRDRVSLCDVVQQARTDPPMLIVCSFRGAGRLGNVQLLIVAAVPGRPWHRNTATQSHGAAWSGAGCAATRIPPRRPASIPLRSVLGSQRRVAVRGAVPLCHAAAQMRHGHTFLCPSARGPSWRPLLRRCERGVTAIRGSRPSSGGSSEAMEPDPLRSRPPAPLSLFASGATS
jgi:hypothetical protein